MPAVGPYFPLNHFPVGTASGAGSTLALSFDRTPLMFGKFAEAKNKTGNRTTIVEKFGGRPMPPAQLCVLAHLEGANNIGTQGEPLDPNGLFNEGGKVSMAANNVPGINAVAGLHDVFQVTLDNQWGSTARNILNVPGMTVAAAITYVGLMTDERAVFIYYTTQMVYRRR